MPTTMIQIEVDAEAAQAFAKASAEEKRKLQLLLSLRLQDLVGRPRKPLKQLMDEISDQAEARGFVS